MKREVKNFSFLYKFKFNYDIIYINIGEFFMNDIIEKQINNEYDYSNIIPDVQSISYLVQYCDSLMQYLMRMIAEDEERNERLKYEYREYQYKKTFDTGFTITISENNVISHLECNSYESFLELVNTGHLSNVKKLTIKLNLSYKTGKEGNLKKHENLFLISFAPYEITFSRKSNFYNSNMNEIEKNINEILKKFGIQNTIFCSK